MPKYLEIHCPLKEMENDGKPSTSGVPCFRANPNVGPQVIIQLIGDFGSGGVNPDVWIQLLTAIHSESLSESWHKPPFTSAYSPRSVDK